MQSRSPEILHRQRSRLIRTGLGVSGTIVVLVGLYYGIELVQRIFGDAAPWVLGIAGLAIYLWTIWYAARFPDLKLDDPTRADYPYSQGLGRHPHRP